MPSSKIVKDIIIITGRAGSGKSTAVAAFEDAGFYCVDNMPVALLPGFLELPLEASDAISGYALVMDLREKGFLLKYPPVFESLKKKGYNITILFLEADSKTLITRYSKTRRHHPLAKGKSLSEGINTEKERLAPLRERADKVIDTSRMTVHELKFAVLNIARKNANLTKMAINVLSFGFKHGPPPEADLMIDVRFLKNPYFEPELRPFSGENKKIADFVLNNDQACLFLHKYLDLLDYLIPLYEKEGKAYLTIAIGCTGGRHRSVAVAAEFFERLEKSDSQVKLTHRDIDKAS